MTIECRSSGEGKVSWLGRLVEGIWGLLALGGFSAHWNALAQDGTRGEAAFTVVDLTAWNTGDSNADDTAGAPLLMPAAFHLSHMLAL